MSLENSQPYRDVAESEAKFRGLIDSNIIGISIWDFDGRVVEANEAFLRILGYERDDLVSGRLRWTDFAPSRYLDRNLQELVAQVQSSGSVQPFEWEFFRKDGSRVSVLVGAALLESKNQRVGFMLDLTDRKRAEQGLKQSEAYLAETQRLTHTGSWAYNHVERNTRTTRTSNSESMDSILGAVVRRWKRYLDGSIRKIGRGCSSFSGG
jgi:PAS domain S-box-containing protein